MRLNQYLSASGYMSRRKGEVVISSGEVRVNGVIVTDPATTVDVSIDKVNVNGVPLVVNPVKRYIVMNKPMGVIVSRGDTHGRPTVYDMLGPEMKGMFTVGRLDSNTSGVLLITDDGDLAYRLTHPSFGVEKIYRAEIEGEVGKSDVKKFKEGVIIDGRRTAPATMVIRETSKNGSLIEITIHEGRKRQVRRMLECIGHPVRVLERISFGDITVHSLSPGAYRPLEAEEVACLKKVVSSDCSGGGL